MMDSFRLPTESVNTISWKSMFWLGSFVVEMKMDWSWLSYWSWFDSMDSSEKFQGETVWMRGSDSFYPDDDERREIASIHASIWIRSIRFVRWFHSKYCETTLFPSGDPINPAVSKRQESLVGILSTSFVTDFRSMLIVLPGWHVVDVSIDGVSLLWRTSST